MKLHLAVGLSLMIVLCVPVWAWPLITDQEVQYQTYGEVVKTAIAESSKALEAGDLGRARYPLVATADLCVPAGGYDPKVTAEVVTAFKDACAKAWPAGQAPDEAAYDAAVAQYEQKFETAYMNAFYLAENCGTYSSTRLFEEFAKGAAQHPEALALALEFSAKSLLPEKQQQYTFQGKHGSASREIQQRIANIYGGPAAVARVCKTEVVPGTLDEAEAEIGRIDPADDPQTTTFRAQMVENDRLKWVRLFDPDNAKCKELQAKIDAIKQKARDLRAAQIAKNRMPSDSYSGGDKADLKAKMAAIFEKQPGASIVKVVIYGQWQEKPFVWVGLNNADAGWYKLIDAAVLCKYADGTFHVHPVTYGRRWIGGDKYGDLEVRGWADQYEILAQYAK